METRIKKEQDGTRDSRIQQPQQKGEIMRQALQVAVGSPMPGQKNEEVIEYSYTATDIAGTSGCPVYVFYRIYEHLVQS